MNSARSFLVLLSVALAGAAQDKKEDAGFLKGDWSVVSMRMGDRSAPADMVKGLTVTFDGRSYTNKSNDLVVEQGTFQVDTTKTPWTIDFSITKGAEAGKRQLGLVAVDAKTLTLCTADAGSRRRPSSLESTPGSPTMVVVMKRSTP